MARPVTTDFLHSMRFHVFSSRTKFLAGRLLPLGGNDPDTTRADAGFSAVGTPGGSIETVEYREGHYIYTRKQPGIPTMDDITMSRGVALREGEFYRWFRCAVEGSGEYRTDLTIRHYHRQTGSTAIQTTLQASPEGINVDSQARRNYILLEALPVSFKSSTDLDANSSEIAIADLTVAYERFEIKDSGSNSETDLFDVDAQDVVET